MSYLLAGRSVQMKDLRASVVAVCDNDTAMMANGRRPSRITGG
jgi:hypothetical protein